MVHRADEAQDRTENNPAAKQENRGIGKWESSVESAESAVKDYGVHSAENRATMCTVPRSIAEKLGMLAIVWDCLESTRKSNLSSG